MSNVKEIVSAKIAGKKVMVFSKSSCSFCAKAKKAFQELIKDGVLSPDDYEVMELDNDPKCDEFQKHLGSITGGTSVPRVFINGKFIGGGDETAQMKANGKLKAILS